MSAYTSGLLLGAVVGVLSGLVLAMFLGWLASRAETRRDVRLQRGVDQWRGYQLAHDEDEISANVIVEIDEGRE
jgi:hypothetical protein